MWLSDIETTQRNQPVDAAVHLYNTHMYVYVYISIRVCVYLYMYLYMYGYVYTTHEPRSELGGYP